MEEREYLRRLEFEHDLINRRMGWLLTSQTILLGAYGLTLDKTGATADLYRRAIPTLGLWSAIAVLLGVTASALAKFFTFWDFRRDHPSAQWGVRTCITILGLVPDFSLPTIFVLAWTRLT